jgi:hypothetical protein
VLKLPVSLVCCSDIQTNSQLTYPKLLQYSPQPQPNSLVIYSQFYVYASKVAFFTLGKIFSYLSCILYVSPFSLLVNYWL